MGRDHLLEFASDFLRAPEWGAPETTEPLPCWHRAVNRVSSKDNNLLPRIKSQRAGEPEHFIREPSCVTGKGRPLLTNGPSHLSFSSNDGYDIAYWRHDRRLSDMGLAISELWKPVDRAPILPTAGASGPGKEAGCRSARDSGLRARPRKRLLLRRALATRRSRYEGHAARTMSTGRSVSRRLAAMQQRNWPGTGRRQWGEGLLGVQRESQVKYRLHRNRWAAKRSKCCMSCGFSVFASEDNISLSVPRAHLSSR